MAWFFGARGNGASLLQDTADYLRGVSIGCVPMILNVILASAVQMDSGSALVQASSLASTLADFALDFLVAKIGWGMYGIGLATSFSGVIGSAVLLLHFCKKNHTLHLAFDKMPWRELKNIMVLGSEKASRRTLNIIRPLLLNTMIISAGGAMGMSALTIRNNVGHFLEIPMAGIAGAVALLTSIAYGEKNKEECRQIGKIAHRYAIVYSAAVLVLMTLFARQIAAFFVEEPGELQDLVVFSMYCLAVGMFFSTLLLSRISYMQGTHRMKDCQVMVFLNKLMVIASCAFVCVHLWHSRGVIVSYVISDILILLGIFVYSVLRRKDKSKMLPTVDDYMALPDDFDIKPQDIIELSIIDVNEEALSSEQLQLFCKGHKLEPVRGTMAALCMEEVILNIIEHGFPTCIKIQPIDLRVVISGDDLIMKIRDHCAQYDINQAIQIIESDTDSDTYLHLKLIANTAKDISYVHMLEMNITIIKL